MIRIHRLVRYVLPMSWMRHYHFRAKQLLPELHSEVQRALQATIPEANDAATVTPCQFADFQCNNSFRLAKKHGKDRNWTPMDVAQRIADNLRGSNLISIAEAVKPGFVNLHLHNNIIGECMQDIAASGFERETQQHPKKVLVDFASPNMCKELHAGHLRSTVLGDALARMFSYCGHEVSRVSHVGDWGTPVGIVLALCRFERLEFDADHLPSPAFLSELYVHGKQRFDMDAGFRAAAYDCVSKLQRGGGDAQLRVLWEALCEASRRGFQETFDRLDVRVTERGESTYAPLIPSTLDELKTKGLAVEDSGALVVRVPRFNAPMIVQKSDGSYLYATTDLATLRQRISEGYDQIVYVTDKTQSEHFRQVFAVGQLAGWYDPTRVSLHHVTFGIIMDSDRKKLRCVLHAVLNLDSVTECVVALGKVVHCHYSSYLIRVCDSCSCMC